MKNKKTKLFKPKEMSSPYSTSGIGYDIEHAVQASFLVLMLANGLFTPLSRKRIVKLELQNRFRKAQTDDLTVYTGNSLSNIYNKMFAQIKRNVKIQQKNKDFRETIESAWLDFNNDQIFNEETDKLALITTPLSDTDSCCIKILLDFASEAKDENEFLLKLETKGHGNKKAVEKLNIIRNIVKHVNVDKEVSDNILWRFLRVFKVFIYDLDIKGVSLALLHTIMEQYDCCDSHFTWCALKDFVAEMNVKEGTITLENIPQNIKNQFINKKESVIPVELVTTLYNIDIFKNPKYRKVLAQASLIGSWSESNENDISIIESIINDEYYNWVNILQEIEQIQNSPIKYKKGIWTINNRKEILKQTQSAIYDIDIERLQKEIINVLTEIDPKFNIEKDKRFYAYIYGQNYKYSYNLQAGLSETVALLGCCGFKFEHAENKLLHFSTFVLNKIFEKPTWELFATLNSCIPTLAESSPSTFIEIINSMVDKNLNILEQLVAQEGDGITGGCYINGLLWALERLAWHPNYFTDSIILLAKLFKVIPQSRWANSPENSITAILMPWHYQTLASIDIQKSTIARFIKEYPQEAVQILIKLLPVEHQMATNTNKPLFLDIFPDDWQYSVKVGARNELVSYYITVLIEQTRANIENILLITKYLNILSDGDFEKVIQIISSEDIINQPEELRVKLWKDILGVVKNHKRFKKAKWAMSAKRIKALEKVLDSIKPQELINTYVPLFSLQMNFDIDEDDKSYKEVEETLNKKRVQALDAILKENNDFSAIKELVCKVETPYMVANALVKLQNWNFDHNIYPELLGSDNSKLVEFTSNYSFQEYRLHGYQWLKQLHFQDWSDDLQILLFKQLPCNSEIWHILDTLNKNIKDSYWKTVNINPYQNDSELELINYLLGYGRPIGAVECINKMLYHKKEVDSSLIIDVLNKITDSDEEMRNIDTYAIGQMIKKLQDDSCVDFETLALLEWKFYSALEHVTKPKFLREKLKRQPKFFCELICMLYKPKDESLIENEPVHEQKLLSHVWTILNELKPLAGYNEEQHTFDSRIFLDWFEEVIKIAQEKTRLDVALNEIGQILFYSPADADGFWIDRNIAELLNQDEYDAMRRGFSSEIINSRGVHWVDPEAKEEFNFAKKYHDQSAACRISGYHRLANTLDEAEMFYQHEAERIIETKRDYE